MFRYAGHHGCDRREDWCQNPARMVCMLCNAWHLKRCGIAKASRCPYCAEEKRLDVSAVGRSGWTDHPGDRGYWVTLTAPGFTWDTSACMHSPDVKCSGEIGCTADPVEMAVWHHGLGLRWSHFVTELRRSLPEGVTVEYFKTWEPQKRGALHAHAMVRVSGIVTVRTFKAAVLKARRLNGFGKQCDVAPVSLADERTVARTAGYCSKYASKGADALPEVQTIDVRTGEVSGSSLRPWSATRGWGDTMAAIRQRRRTFAQALGGLGAAPPLELAGGAEGTALDLNRNIYASGSPLVPPERAPVLSDAG